MSIHESFTPGVWKDEINVHDFVLLNHTPYLKDFNFLQDSTESTMVLWEKIEFLVKNRGTVLSDTISSILSLQPDYIDLLREKIQGLFSDGNMSPMIGFYDKQTSFTSYALSHNTRVSTRKTFSEAFSDISTKDFKRVLRYNVLSWMPVHSSNNFFLPDIRLIPLYGSLKILENKKWNLRLLERHPQNVEWIEKREQLIKEIDSLKDLEKFASTYNIDISKPAENAKECVQYAFITYCACVRENPCISFPLGRITQFFDIYIEHDLKRKVITEQEAQELIEQFFLKINCLYILGSDFHKEFLKGIPSYVFESVGGANKNGSSLVTKTTFRFLSCLKKFSIYPVAVNVLWSNSSTIFFKRYISELISNKVPIYFLNDELFRSEYGDNYSVFPSGGIGEIGNNIVQDAGVVNLPKTLLLAINGGKDEISGTTIFSNLQPCRTEKLNFAEVIEKFKDTLSWIISTQVDMANVCAYYNYKYCPHFMSSALSNFDPNRVVDFSFMGLDELVNSLSAITNADVSTVRDKNNLVTGFKCIGDFPKFSDDSSSIIDIVNQVCGIIYEEVNRFPIYNKAKPKVKFLVSTIKNPYTDATGETPSSRKSGACFALANEINHNFLFNITQIPFFYANAGVDISATIGSEMLSGNALFLLLEEYFQQGGTMMGIADEKSLAFPISGALVKPETAGYSQFLYRIPRK